MNPKKGRLTGTVLLAVALFCFGSASAGDQVADFSIDASVIPSGVTPPGTAGVLTIVVSNIGPDSGVPIFEMERTDDGTGVSTFPPLQFEFPGALLTGPCTTPPEPVPPQGEFLSWITPTLEASESVECTFAFTVGETSVLSQVARWAVRPFSGATDSNDENNVANVLLRFAESTQPVSVPVNSVWASLILMVLLGWLVWFRVPGYRA